MGEVLGQRLEAIDIVDEHVPLLVREVVQLAKIGELNVLLQLFIELQAARLTGADDEIPRGGPRACRPVPWRR